MRALLAGVINMILPLHLVWENICPTEYDRWKSWGSPMVHRTIAVEFF